MKIKIWGARGSIPAPISPQAIREKIVHVLQNAQDVDLSDPVAVSDYVSRLDPLIIGTAGGNTACVQAQAGQETIIIDAGSGIRALGNDLMAGACGKGQGVIHLFISHPHWDHIQGLPFFAPAFVPGNRIIIYGVHDSLEAALDLQMRAPMFPVPFSFLRSRATIDFVSLKEGEPITLGDGIRVNNIRLPHPGNSYGFRFEQRGMVFVYASDAEYKQLDAASLDPFVRFYRDADALIFDAQYSLSESVSKADWGHSSAMIGVEIARQANVKRLVLFHHDPINSDAALLQTLSNARDYQSTLSPQAACEILVAYEGLTIDLTRRGTTQNVR